MKVKQYLLTQDAISLAYVAKKMWPTNKSANTYLTIKLLGKDPGRQWTVKDEENARKALHDLGIELTNL